MLNLEKTHYLVQRIDDPSSTIGIDIEQIVKQECRLNDIAMVNVQTAPELLMTFNKLWLELNRMVTLLNFEKNKAENLLRRYRAEAVLNCTEETLLGKGHKKASADLREAVADTDPKVVETTDRLEELRALVSYLQGKQEAFREGFQSVKKIIGIPTLSPQHGNGGMPAPFSQVPANYQILTQTKIEDPEFDLPAGFRS